jgi:hypothetical protein
MRPLLNGVRIASSDEQLKSMWEAFKAQFPSAKTLIKFIDTKWMTPEKKAKWTTFSREAGAA